MSPFTMTGSSAREQVRRTAEVARSCELTLTVDAPIWYIHGGFAATDFAPALPFPRSC